MVLTSRVTGGVVEEGGHGGFHERAVGEDGVDDAAGDVEVAHPAAAVAFRRVPDALLHAEVGGVGAGFPDAVQQRVGGFERALVFDRVGDALGVDPAPGGVGIGREDEAARSGRRSWDRRPRRGAGR